MRLNVAKYGGFNSAVGKIEARPTVALLDRFAVVSSAAVGMFNLGGRKLDRLCISVGSKPVDDWTSGISKAEKFRDFVEGLSRGIVAGVADIFVGPGSAFLRCEIKMRVSAGDDEGEHRKLQNVVSLLPLFEKNRVDVSLEVIDRRSGAYRERRPMPSRS